MAKLSKKVEGKERLVLLDAHAILHRAYHALPEFTSSRGEPTGALYGLVSMLIKIIGDLKPDYIVACYDLPGPTYRHEAYEGYKAQRKKAEDDLVSQIERSQDIFKAFHIPIYSKPGFEADDILGTIAEETKGDKQTEVVIASGDMDTLQLVEDERVKVYTLKKGINDTILYDAKKVMERFGFSAKQLPDYKGLRGDPSDNIIGVKGIGEKTATTLITEFETIENMYKVLKKDPDGFREKSGVSERIANLLKDNEEEAEFSKMLATIRRDVPISFTLGKKWQDDFVMEDAEKIFADLDFRTLDARLKGVLNPKSVEDDSKEESEQLSFNSAGGELDEKDVESTALALWVVDSNFTNPTLDDVLRFAKTRDYVKAKEIIFSELEKRGGKFVYDEIEKPLVPIVKSMESLGVKLDKDYLAKLSKDYHKKLDELEKEIWHEAGEEFNIASPKQLGVILFEKLGLKAKNMKKTSGGSQSTKESELEKLRDQHPIIGKVMEYREFAKLLSTYIDNIPSMLDKEGRLHTNLRQAGTTTGRMSSTKPNIQNIPIKTELGRNVRKAFVAKGGYSFVSFDYSQIEMRIAAILSDDKKLLEIFRSGEDVHSAVASHVFDVPLDKVDKEMRRQAKVINFGIIYGMGVNALRQNLGGTREEAQKFYNNYFSRFTDLAGYLDKVKSEAARRGYTETLFGRRRYFEGIKSKIPYIKAAAERMAVNAPFQGSAADLMKLAMIHIGEYIEKNHLEKDVRMMLQVHDELDFEIKKEKVMEVAPEIKRIMEEVMTEEQRKGIPCTAHGSFGPNWDEQEKLDL